MSFVVNIPIKYIYTVDRVEKDTCPVPCKDGAVMLGSMELSFIAGLQSVRQC